MTQITATIKKQTILATINKRSISAKANGNIILAKPAGSDGEIQFNDNGVFGSFGNYNKETGELNLSVLNLSGAIENDSQAITLGYFNLATSSFLSAEVDPVFTASPAHGIDNQDIADWNEAHSWGNHAGLYSLLNHNHTGVYDPANTASGLLSAHNLAFNHSLIASALQSETDPIFSHWLATTPPLYSFTESDPVWNAQKANYSLTSHNHTGVYQPAGAYALLSEVWKINGNTVGGKKNIGNIDNFDFGILTNNTERITVLANGNVGIGTIAPRAKLDIRSTDLYAVTPFAQAVHAPSQSPYIAGFFNDTYSTTTPVMAYFGYDNGNFNLGTFGGKLLLGAGGNLSFGSTPRLTIDNTTGNVGIGTTNPTQGQLVVSQNIVANQQNAKMAVLGSAAGYLAYPGIWFGSATPTISNYTFLSDPTGNTFLNAQSGGAVCLGINNIYGLTMNSNGVAINNGTNLAGTGVGLVVGSGNVGIGITTPTAKLDVNSDIFRLRTAKTPATAGASGNAGDICWDSGFVYVCVATNTWKRSALGTW